MARVLVVDDDALVRNAVRRHLERAGYEVTVFASGEEALEHAARTSPEVMVVDIFMDGVEGLELTRRVKEANLDTKVIAISGGGVMKRRSVLEVASHLGAHGTLTKPFSGKHLVELVGRLCGTETRGPEAAD